MNEGDIKFVSKVLNNEYRFKVLMYLIKNEDKEPTTTELQNVIGEKYIQGAWRTLNNLVKWNILKKTKVDKNARFSFADTEEADLIKKYINLSRKLNSDNKDN